MKHCLLPQRLHCFWQLVPAVPHKSPNQNRATYTPDVIYTITRFPVDFFLFFSRRMSIRPYF